MQRATRVIRNTYRDSVSLMQLSAQLAAVAGISQAQAVMASAGNLALLRDAGLLDEAVEAGANDLLIAVAGDDGAALAAAFGTAEGALNERAARRSEGPRRAPPRSLQMGLAEVPEANLALVSTPGDYAGAEAMKALRLGLNVMLFSDNVPLADEVALKRYAASRGLLVMGPDCGTAIIDGVPLGFANAVRRGRVSVIGASGTGMQQVTCLLDRYGVGISQAIGTGGRDLDRAVGGATMLAGLALLGRDPATHVIVLISKPPDAQVAARVVDAARASGKPLVVNFLGTGTATLEDAAKAAATLAGAAVPTAEAPHDVPRFRPQQRYVRGLFSGGTFCYEAALLLSAQLAPVLTNTPVGSAAAIDDVWKSRGHTLLDLGDDQFTRGRPHPMIDLRLRRERLLAEAADPEVAAILVDVVLGYGAHPDPAGALAEAIAEAGRRVAVVGFVCGTESDPQQRSRQERKLAEAGAILAPSSTAAARLALRFALAAEGR
jgi:FdrA protein